MEIKRILGKSHLYWLVLVDKEKSDAYHVEAWRSGHQSVLEPSHWQQIGEIAKRYEVKLVAKKLS